MNIALLGFESFPKVKAKLVTLLTQNQHSIVKTAEKADLVLVPHHLDDLFPEQKAWIAIWVSGGVGRLQLLFQELDNKPLELVLDYQIENNPEILLNKLQR